MVDKVKSQRQLTSTPNVFGLNRKANKKLLEMSPIKEPDFPVSKKTPMLKLVVQAIKAVGLPKRGASLIAIKKWIEANGDSSYKNQTLFLKKAILKAIESGEIVRAPHSANAHGVTGCFILPPISKKVKSTPTKIAKNKRIAKLPKMNEKVSKAPKSHKEQKTKQNVKAVKKTYNKKTRSSPLKGTTETKSKHTSPHRNVSKKGTNRNPISSRISSKPTKSEVPLPKLPVKRAVKKKSPSAVKLDKKGSISSSSDKDNVEYPEQEIEIKNENNANTVKVKQTKAPKEKTLAKTIGKDENNPKKGKPKKDSKEVKKEFRTIRSRINKEINTALSILEKELKRRDSEVTRKEVSDTELNKKDEPIPCKSYVSDTELETSKMVRQSKIKMKRSNKDIKKMQVKQVPGKGKDADNTTSKSQSKF